MRILFVMRHGGYVRNFEWVLRALAERGHQVQLGFERGRAKGMEERIERGRGGFDLPDKLREDTGGAVDHDLVPTREDRWRGLAFGLRQSVSYLRYLSPAYRDAAKLRERWARGTPRVVVHARAGLVAARPARACAPLGGAPRAAVGGGRRPPSRRRLRRGADHPARRRPLAARLAAQRPGGRDPGRARGRKLGQPDEQGRDVRPARPHVRLERDPAARGGRAARSRPGHGRGARRPHLRPLVRVAAEHRARGLPATGGAESAGRSCSTSAPRGSLPPTSGRSSRPGSRRCGSTPSSPASACSSGRTRRTARSGPSTPWARSRTSPCGRASARTPPTVSGARASTTRSTTRPRWSARTRRR